eukprot:GAHX01000759.1.p1 GENE.GAHX01000759.1~~GAHX01000759.1.p1  ORF type:complete len:278 (+),score=54.67 GAHX01000759.1:39-872(+)
MDKSFKLGERSYLTPEENAPLTSEEQELFDRCKEIIQKDLEESKVSLNDSAIIRFVRGYFYEKPRFEKTLQFIREHINARKLGDLDNILENEPPKLSEYREVFSEIWHRNDKYGHIVKIVSLKKCKLKEIKKRFSEEEMKKLLFYTMELTLHKLAEMSKEGGVTIYKVFTVFDFTDIGIWSGLKDLNTLVNNLTKVFENNYPEIAYKTMLINTSFMLRSIVKLLLLGANKYTKKKIVITSSSGDSLTKELLQYIEVEDLPKAYGGKCECDDCSILSK